MMMLFCVAVQINTLKVGDRVASAFSTSCGQCYYCKHALSCRCEKGGRFGWIVDGKGIEGSQVSRAACLGMHVTMPMVDQ